MGNFAKIHLKSNIIEEFKLKIKLWNSENCPCRLFEKFLPQDAFL